MNCSFCSNKITTSSLPAKLKTGYCYKCEISYELTNNLISQMVIWNDDRPSKLVISYKDNKSILLKQNVLSKRWDSEIELGFVLAVNNLSINDYFNLVKSKIDKLQVFK